MSIQLLTTLSLFLALVVLSYSFLFVIILDFRSTLHKRRAFYAAIGAPEHAGSWKRLSYTYVSIVTVCIAIAALILYFQPHVY